MKKRSEERKFCLSVYSHVMFQNFFLPCALLSFLVPSGGKLLNVKYRKDAVKVQQHVKRGDHQRKIR